MVCLAESRDDLDVDEKQDEAIQKAFQKGQDAWRDNKRIDENPYPSKAVDYYEAWIQGCKRKMKFNGSEIHAHRP